MEMLKQLGVLIEQATNDANQEPPVAQYERILDIINSRVDMPKHTINGVSKRLSLKNKKVLYYCFDLMQYLSYRCQLALFSQISSKEFLLKISGLLMNQELEAGVHTKILQTVRCWEELFRPHEDLLPMFFQFYAGLLRKDFPIQANYVSPYRPKDFKIYKKTQNKKKQENKDKPAKPVAQPTKTEKKTFEEIREKLILTNQIIDNANPAEGVKGNEILLEMMEEIKACEKRINQTINENPNESIMELALAVNDDIYITYRRFKDLQKNRKPEIFILTELNSDMRKETEAPKKQEKVEKKPAEKPSLPKDIFDIDNFQEKPKQPVQVKKEVDIFDIACDPIKPEKKEQSLMDLTLESSSVQTQPSNVNIFDLLGNKPEPEPQPQPQLVPQPITLQTNPYVSNNGFPQPNTFQSNSGLNFAPNPYQSNNINVTLSNNFQTQNDIKKYDNKTILQRISDITDFSDFLKK